ncbi:MAG: FAD-dependent oxidoreductase [Candidatus Methanoperedens sp.]|nr:FAD-dependent oxidoreductase [Candidatus Methanoperedens sp.]
MVRNEMPPYYQTVILGAGLCGLSAAYHLEAREDADYALLERNSEIGGLVRTKISEGFSFDHAIHILYSRDPYALELICNKLLKDNIHKQMRQSYCYTNGIFTEYPYQTNNFGLPPAVIFENLIGLIEAKITQKEGMSPQNFEDWIFRNFGRGIAKHFMVPYNRRQWAWDLKDMNYDWIAGRVPVPEMGEVLRGALQPPTNKYGPNQEFYYPVRGGIEALSQSFLRFIPQDRLQLNATVVGIDGARHEVIMADGRRIRYGRLISTIPLPVLVHLLGGGIPSTVRQSAEGLKFNIVHTVNIGLEGPDLGPVETMHWVYFADKDTIFHRLSIPKNFSPHTVPDGCSSLQLEISESVHRPCNRNTLIEQCLSDLVRVGILEDCERKRVQTTEVVTLEPAYIIYDQKHRQNIGNIIQYLTQLDISSKGRFGEWEYLNMDQAILSGKRAVEEIA